MPAGKPETYEFHLEIHDPSLTEKDVRRLLQQALSDASDAATRAEGTAVEAEVEIRGGFAGLVAPVVILILKALLVGTGEAGGKYFFDKYLKPRLDKIQLFPSGFKPLQGEKK